MNSKDVKTFNDKGNFRRKHVYDKSPVKKDVSNQKDI